MEARSSGPEEEEACQFGGAAGPQECTGEGGCPLVAPLGVQEEQEGAPRQPAEGPLPPQLLPEALRRPVVPGSLPPDHPRECCPTSTLPPQSQRAIRNMPTMKATPTPPTSHMRIITASRRQRPNIMTTDTESLRSHMKPLPRMTGTAPSERLRAKPRPRPEEVPRQPTGSTRTHSTEAEPPSHLQGCPDERLSTAAALALSSPTQARLGLSQSAGRAALLDAGHVTLSDTGWQVETLEPDDVARVEAPDSYWDEDLCGLALESPETNNDEQHPFFQVCIRLLLSLFLLIGNLSVVSCLDCSTLIECQMSAVLTHT
ncbi:KH domain-containing, RNA-binding, signal transduction-associated protein 1b isoform X2 [Hippocampus zosterae]|uniref:KH domain-containing, RNA-binding, signal transduction-associated protein 1b isoform X2 n=1 Tax=Hippocampus zosterae TaxID=109293 RepID=UPI00223CA226|nr:KH domain-containing, RNA-binding, signal transduction-associated protein 1b isoform X2 [Hippocampus zosterae]